VPSYAFVGYPTYKPVYISIYSTLVYITRHYLVLGLIYYLLIPSFLHTHTFINTSTNLSNCSGLPLMLHYLTPPTNKTTIPSRLSLPYPPWSSYPTTPTPLCFYPPSRSRRISTLWLRRLQYRIWWLLLPLSNNPCINTFAARSSYILSAYAYVRVPINSISLMVPNNDNTLSILPPIVSPLTNYMPYRSALGPPPICIYISANLSSRQPSC
jgi:hypothetical protein